MKHATNVRSSLPALAILGIAFLGSPPATPMNQITAIGILLDPNATMTQQAQAVNERLHKNMPAGFALAQEKPTTWAYNYYYLPSKDIGLAGIVIEPADERIRYQQKLTAAVDPFTAETGIAASSEPGKEGAQAISGDLPSSEPEREGAPSDEQTAPPQAKAETKMAKGADWVKDPKAWRVTVYPVYAFVPLARVLLNLPPFPELPGGGGSGPSGTATGINGAVATRFEIQKRKWLIEGNGYWAGLSVTRNTFPKIQSTINGIYGQMYLGYEVLPKLFLEGGARRMGLRIDATIAGFPPVSPRVGVWDPVVGFTYIKQLSRKWTVRGHFDEGGFGVGSDLSGQGDIRLDWRFAKHFVTTFGFGGYYFRITPNVSKSQLLREILTVSTASFGPIFGFGIFF